MQYDLAKLVPRLYVVLTHENLYPLLYVPLYVYYLTKHELRRRQDQNGSLLTACLSIGNFCGIITQKNFFNDVKTRFHFVGQHNFLVVVFLSFNSKRTSQSFHKNIYWRWTESEEGIKIFNLSKIGRIRVWNVAINIFIAYFCDFCVSI